ncbi:hypothetical protein Tco_0280531 [Tanacetum coccineum]
MLGESSAHIATITPTEETPSHTKGKKDEMVTKEIVHETKNVEKEPVKEPKVETVEKELVQKPHVTKPIPIIIINPITKHPPEIKMIGSSSRLQLTDTILEIQVPQPKSPQATLKPDRGKGKVTDADESPPKLAHLDKEEKLEKAVREARLRKPELINVVHEEATKVGVDPKALSSVKGGQEFIKIQDVKFKVLNREHSEKIKKSRELRKKRIEQYR